MFKKFIMFISVVIALAGCNGNKIEEESAVNLVTVTADANGAASSDLKAAAKGQKVTLTATPADGYEFAGWVVTSGNLTLEDATANPLTFTMPGAAVSFKATFRAEEIAVYPISVTAGKGGSVNWGASIDGESSVMKPSEVAADWIVALSAEPESGYRFVRWEVRKGNFSFASGSETSVSANFVMPAEEVSIEGLFEEAIYSIVVEDVTNGKIEIENGLEQAKEGTIIRLKATPDEGYKFMGWELDGYELNLGNLKNPGIAFKMPGNDLKVSARFELPLDDVLSVITDPVLKEYAGYCMTHSQEITIDEYWYGDTERTWKGAVKKTLEATVTPVTETYPAWDTDGDGRLSEQEAAAIRAVDVSRAALDRIGISGTVKAISFDGYLYGVELLHASYQEIEEIYANEFPSLKTLVCDHSGLKKLTLDKCPNLEKLFVEHNQLAELGITKNRQLNSLSCWDNHIGKLDISQIRPKDGKFFLRMGAQRHDDNPVLNETPPAVRPEGLSDAEYEAYKKTDEYLEKVRKLHKSVEASMSLNVHNSHWGAITEDWCDELQYNRMVGWVSW